MHTQQPRSPGPPSAWKVVIGHPRSPRASAPTRARVKAANAQVRDPLARFRGPADALALGVDMDARAALDDFLRKCEDAERADSRQSPPP